MDVAIVGAGICGLAAADALQRRGARVVVYEAERVGAGQSAGLARIFRIAHASPRLCALALEARAGWLAWERSLGAGRLLGEEGLIVARNERRVSRAVVEKVDLRAAAMQAAGAPAQELTAGEVRERLPFFDYAWGGGLWDPLAGALRIRRALDALAARVTIRRETVTDLEALDADAVLVCAGLGTQALVPELDFELRTEPHVRLTYDAGAAAPCVISAELYGCPIGSTGRFAVGMHDQAAAPAMVPLPVVDRVECVSLFAPWLDAHGDGFLALRTGRVTAFTGANLMKFGPLLGDRLARSVLDGAIHADLTFGQ
ncbi:FAD-binding oxidoreductase [Solirubrobacter ginsenosidimutans]|uniref:FAD-binding oxidoreductase n=1 Tax=Solirubrobacter ginsenosidimutans TaxID=490573 RepID=A0A9X3MTA6_9ACTN|nr:FAD-binding oxidoreductase [Solirubrobacter ginsenosidimutans]MDA0162130.1 FAD-binding oxidoreductase [Solirubrobacter ginsenosidimutans]